MARDVAEGGERGGSECSETKTRETGAFVERYNNDWLLQGHGYMTPARARKKLSRRTA